MLDDNFDGAANQTIVDAPCEAKNTHGSYTGTSPSQWFVGRSRHPLIDADAASPNLTKGSEFEQHLLRKMSAAQAFHEADTKIQS